LPVLLEHLSSVPAGPAPKSEPGQRAATLINGGHPSVPSLRIFINYQSCPSLALCLRFDICWWRPTVHDRQRLARNIAASAAAVPAYCSSMSISSLRFFGACVDTNMCGSMP
jgi:hypothetical protein